MQIKQYILVICMFLLCSCSSNNTDVPAFNPDTIKYIEPTNDVEVFDLLNQNTYDILYKANDNNEIKSYILQSFGKEMIDYEIEDYYGNSFNLVDHKNEKVIFEISAAWCDHCMKQASKYNKDIKENYPDITIIQYFNEGDKEAIESFYKEIDMDIPKDITVIPSNDDFSKLLLSTYDPRFYPGFIVFNNGVVTFIRISQFTKHQMDLAYDVCFNNAVTTDDLVDDDGVPVLDYNRCGDDVMKDLNDDNIAKLKRLDNDNYTLDITLDFIGKEFDYYDQLEDDSTFNMECNILDYVDKDTIYVFFNKVDEDKIDMINKYANEHKDISVVGVDITDTICKQLANKLDVPVISIMNQIPKIMNDISFVTYPSCVFVEKSVITGVYSNILDTDSLNFATNIFFGEESIALRKNNLK